MRDIHHTEIIGQIGVLIHKGLLNIFVRRYLRPNVLLIDIISLWNFILIINFRSAHQIELSLILTCIFRLWRQPLCFRLVDHLNIQVRCRWLICEWGVHSDVVTFLLLVSLVVLIGLNLVHHLLLLSLNYFLFYFLNMVQVWIPRVLVIIEIKVLLINVKSHLWRL